MEFTNLTFLLLQRLKSFESKYGIYVFIDYAGHVSSLSIRATMGGEYYSHWLTNNLSSKNDLELKANIYAIEEILEEYKEKAKNKEEVMNFKITKKEAINLGLIKEENEQA